MCDTCHVAVNPRFRWSVFPLSVVFSRLIGDAATCDSYVSIAVLVGFSLYLELMDVFPCN